MGYGFIYSDIFDDVPEEERSPQMIAIYSYLCSRAGAKGECWVGHKNIMRHTGIKNKKTLLKYQKKLEGLGLIEVERRKKEGSKANDTNLYKISAIETQQIPLGPTNGTEIISINNNTEYISENSSSREAKPHSYDTTTTTEIIEHLNKKSGNQFKVTPKIKEQVKGLLEAGYTAKDVNIVIDVKVPQFLAEGKDYLVQPSKLFDVDRFDDYLQESINGISQYQKANQPRKRVVHPEWEGKTKQQQQQLTPEEVAANEEAMRKQLNDQLKHLRAN